MKLQNAKGTRDYLPEDMIAINNIIDKLKHTFESCGFNPLSTPLIERFDVLSAKYAGGSEILKETFRLTDQGKRDLGLRYDLTVPFARVVGTNPQLKFPFKRYQIEKVYRDGPIGKGRYREFWQCDIDVVGSSSMSAEAELLYIVENFFSSLGLKAVININNRKILDAIFEKFKIQNSEKAMLIIDKWKKVSAEDLIKELIENGENESVAKELIDFFKEIPNTVDGILEIVPDNEGLSEIKELLDICTNSYSLKSIKFNPLLARGLSYYTSTMIEVTLEDSAITSTVCAGGRYDKMIQNLLGSKDSYPTVGLSFGLSRIFDALVLDEKLKLKKTVTDVFVYSINQDSEAIKVVKELRSEGINTEFDLMSRKPGKNLKYVISMDIPFVIVIGEDEVKSNLVSLRIDREWRKVSLEEAIKLIKKN